MKMKRELYDELGRIVWLAGLEWLRDEPPHCFEDLKGEEDEYIMVPLSQLKQWERSSFYLSQQNQELVEKMKEMKEKMQKMLDIVGASE